MSAVAGHARSESASAMLAIDAVHLEPAEREENKDDVKGDWRTEFRQLSALASPIMAYSCLQFGMIVTNQIMVGQLLGKEKLAAAALANVLFDVVYYFLSGCGTALDTLASQAFGAGSGSMWLMWTRTAAICMSVLCVPAMVVLLLGPVIAKYIFRQDDNMSQQIGMYAQLLVPGLPALVWAFVLQKGLQSRHIVNVPLVIMAICFLMNILLNLVLIDAWGFAGAPAATSFTNWLFLLLFVGYWYKRWDVLSPYKGHGFGEGYQVGKKRALVNGVDGGSEGEGEGSEDMALTQHVTADSPAQQATGRKGVVAGDKPNGGLDEEVGLERAPKGIPDGSEGGIGRSRSSKGGSSVGDCVRGGSGGGGGGGDNGCASGGQSTGATREGEIELGLKGKCGTDTETEVPSSSSYTSAAAPPLLRTATSEKVATTSTSTKNLVTSTTPTTAAVEKPAKVTKKEANVFLTLAWYGGCTMVVEALSFSITTAFAGGLGEDETAATASLLMIIAFIYFTAPFGMSMALSVHVGHFLGADRPRRAKFASALAMVAIVTYMTVFGVVLWVFKDDIGRIFTSDPVVIKMVADIAPFGAVNCIADGVQAVAGGILRGMGKQRTSLMVNFIGMWCVGVVLGYVLTFPLGFGLKGLWCGIVCGILTAAALNTIVMVRSDWHKEADKAAGLIQTMSTRDVVAATVDAEDDDDDNDSHDNDGDDEAGAGTVRRGEGTDHNGLKCGASIAG